MQAICTETEELKQSWKAALLFSKEHKPPKCQWPQAWHRHRFLLNAQCKPNSSSPHQRGVESNRGPRERVLQACSDNTSIASAFTAQPFKQWMKVGTLSTTLCKWTHHSHARFHTMKRKKLKWALLPTSLHSDEQWPKYHNWISKRFNLLKQPSQSRISVSRILALATICAIYKLKQHPHI